MIKLENQDFTNNYLEPERKVHNSLPPLLPLGGEFLFRHYLKEFEWHIWKFLAIWQEY